MDKSDRAWLYRSAPYTLESCLPSDTSAPARLFEDRQHAVAALESAMREWASSLQEAHESTVDWATVDDDGTPLPACVWGCGGDHACGLTATVEAILADDGPASTDDEWSMRVAYDGHGGTMRWALFSVSLAAAEELTELGHAEWGEDGLD